MKNYKLVGLTGTTGAGKGQVRIHFENCGYKSIDADVLAREIMKNPIVINAVKNNFGEDIFADNILNRKLLAQRAFKDKESTALLNSITHPFICALFLQEVENLVKKGFDKIIFDAPQLFESKISVLCDRVVAVLADEDLRISRIMARDSITCDQAKRRMAIQFTDDFFKSNSDYVIENNGDLETLKTKTLTVINNI